MKISVSALNISDKHQPKMDTFHQRQVASPAMGHWVTCPLYFQQFHFCSLWSKPESQLSKYCV